MYTYSPLSEILLKKSFGKLFFKVWSRDYFCEKKIRFLTAFLKRNIF